LTPNVRLAYDGPAIKVAYFRQRRRVGVRRRNACLPECDRTARRFLPGKLG
jgi:hypothetical protein